MSFLFLKTFLISMLPVGELRAGIPYGTLAGLNPILVYFMAVIGNMVPVFFLLWFLPKLEKWLFDTKKYRTNPIKLTIDNIKMTSDRGDNESLTSNSAANADKQSLDFKQSSLQNLSLSARLYRWYRNRLKHKHSKNFERFGSLALIIFVAIPLPLTGAWSGALAAHIFNISFKKSLASILLGVMIAGMIVSLVSAGIF